MADPVWATTGRVVKITTTVIVVAAVAIGLFAARVVLLLSFLAIVIAGVLSFPVDWLSRWLPRWLAVMMTLVVFASCCTGAAVLGAPIMRRQMDKLPAQLNAARQRLESLWEAAPGGEAISEEVAVQVPKAAASALPIAARTAAELASGAVVLIIVAFFLVTERDQLYAGARSLMPDKYGDTFLEWWTRTGHALRSWTGGILVSMTIMGTLTAVGLALVGINEPVFLGLVTFMGTFVPYVGALASALPGLAIALSQSPNHFLYACAVYLVVHHVEGYLVQPLIMRRAVKLRPSMLVFWEAVMGATFGIVGIVVATPMLACVTVSIEYLWKERRLLQRDAH